ERGRSLGALDFGSHAPHVLVGASLYHRLEAAGEPLGRTLELGGESYEIVGGLGAIAVDSGGGTGLSGVDWNRAVVVPLGAEPGRAGAPDEDYPVDLVVLRLPDPSSAAGAASLLSGLSRDGIAVITPEQALAS